MNKTKEFIIKARSIHGKLFNYNKTVYANSKKKVYITCPKHGDFEQTPNNHLRGAGCPTCGKLKFRAVREVTKDVFIERSKQIHCDKYNYDNVNYVNTHTKVSIYCNRCKVYFEQTPTAHMSGKGHITCSLTLDNDDFVTKAKTIHGDRYEYDKVVYKFSYEPVTITCKIHGDFEQTPHSHFKGHGCYTCGRISLGDKTRTNKDEYIRKAKELHGDKFDYSKMNFISLNKPVTIICPTHGEFTQRADGHLKYGCERCHYESKLHTQEEFINKCKVAHGDKYDYSKTKYSKLAGHIDIICPTHGVFTQQAAEHVRGAGCQLCSSSRGESKLRAILLRNSLKVIREFKFPVSKYRYDFYLPELNILLEYDGVQHYRPVEFFGGKKAHDTNVANDKNKELLAATHGVNIIRVPYLVYNNMEQYLNTKFSKIIKYKKDGLYFKNFLEFGRYFNLPGDATPKEYKDYLFKLI